MKLSRITAIAGSLFAGPFLAVILSAPAFATPDAHSALPGTLNYVEGQAYIGQDSLNANSIGNEMLRPGETLSTDNGKAEILLTPGVFLRVDSNSAVKMISPSITDTEVELGQGRAMVEVAEIHDQNNLRISEGGVETRLVKKGVYEFDADRQEILGPRCPSCPCQRMAHYKCLKLDEYLSSTNEKKAFRYKDQDDRESNNMKLHWLQFYTRFFA